MGHTVEPDAISGGHDDQGGQGKLDEKVHIRGVGVGDVMEQDLRRGEGEKKVIDRHYYACILDPTLFYSTE